MVLAVLIESGDIMLQRMDLGKIWIDQIIRNLLTKLVALRVLKDIPI